ncbi:hypothetical protein NKH18_32120 [Streptomyces sp. M10(2022)]
MEKAADSVRADADPAAGKVAFGFLHTMGSETVPGLIRAFRVDHPGSASSSCRTTARR